MPDYYQAVKEGVNAAMNAQKLNAEVDKVFQDLEHQILKNTDGKIKVYRKALEAKNADGYIRNWEIVAESQTGNDSIVEPLARWSQNGRGYPCLLEWGGDEFVAQDREALQELLLKLLSDSVVGKKLITLMNLESTQVVA